MNERMNKRMDSDAYLYRFFQKCNIAKKGTQYKRCFDLENNKTCIIWIEVKLENKKSILLMGGYRQWKSTKYFDDKESGSDLKQLNRLKLIIESWEKALKEKKHVVVLMDDNLDSSQNSLHNKIYKLKDLYEIWQQHLDKHNITQHNFKYTHFRPNTKQKCIDHSYLIVQIILLL